MESLLTQIEFYRTKGHKVPNLSILSEEELQALLLKLQTDDYNNFKENVHFYRSILSTSMNWVFFPGDKSNQKIRALKISDILEHPEQHSFMVYEYGISKLNKCKTAIHRVKNLYIVNLMKSYETLGDAFDAEYDKYARLMLFFEIYSEKHSLLTPNILTRIEETGDHADIFLDTDMKNIMDAINEAEIDLRALDQSKVEALKDAMVEFKHCTKELRDTLQTNKNNNINNNNEELTPSMVEFTDSMDKLGQSLETMSGDGKECRIM